MKKLWVIAVVLLMAGSAYAEERLNLSGSYRVRAWSWDNFSDLDSDNDGDENQYWDQRFRLGAKLTVAEGITANLRFDFAEAKWGAEFSEGWANPTEAKEIQVDRTYIKLDKEMYALSIGQQWMGWGEMIAIDDQVTGIIATIKTPVNITLAYAKLDEGAGLADGAADVNEDRDFYGVNAEMMMDEMSAGGFVGMITDGTPAEAEPMVVGLYAKAALAGLNVTGELDYFMGENAATDYVGTQLYLDAKMDMEPAMVGASLFYAMGTDDSDETQITAVMDASGDFVPMDIGAGAFWTLIDPLGAALGGDVFELTDNSGSMGLNVYSSCAFAERFKVSGNLGYLTPAEDDVTDLDNVMIVNVGVEYAMATNTKLAAAYNYTMVDGDGAYDDADAASVLGAMLQLSF
ncbi:MAG: hypothetical protein CSA22_01345 [Deltaproteobacteria bacterium]|nr:MAG: hypothetical protein CSA22_01345 [Deltaproteobacteria bacterium]